MQSPNPSQPINLDPWSASSLLQKAIRRGEVSLAQFAASELHRHRGNAIWRRLMNIAIEDVGIACPGLVWAVTHIATDKSHREALGTPPKLLIQLCSKLAEVPKDRSVDYVYCAATKLETAQDDLGKFASWSVSAQRDVAVDRAEPLARRAVAAMLACTAIRSGKPAMVESLVAEFIAALPCEIPEPLRETVLTLARQRSHPFSLMLPLVWDRFAMTGCAAAIVDEVMPEAEIAGGIPLYVYDKHTAVGKRALSLLPARCPEVLRLLTKWVPSPRHAEVIRMAAFYADAAPIARRLNWSCGGQLEFIGFQADMLSAGCPSEAATLIVKCVRANLRLLNSARRAACSLVAVGNLAK